MAKHEKASLTPEETKTLEAAIKGFTDNHRFATLIKDVAAGGNASFSYENINLTMNKDHKLEVTMRTEDGLIATEFFSPDGKPLDANGKPVTSSKQKPDITLHAPTLEGLSVDQRKAVVAGVEAQSKTLRNALDPRHQLELEEVNASGLQTVSHEQQAGKLTIVSLKKGPSY